MNARIKIKVSCRLVNNTMELKCEVNSGNETLYGEFNSRIDGSFNQADHAGVTGLTTGFGFDRSALKAETVCLIGALFT